jgi:hypothetical protein
VHEEEDVSAGLFRRGCQAGSPRPLEREDPGAGIPEGIPRGGAVAAVGDEELTSRVETEASKVPGDVGGLVPDGDDDGDERGLLRASMLASGSP